MFSAHPQRTVLSSSSPAEAQPETDRDDSSTIVHALLLFPPSLPLSFSFTHHSHPPPTTLYPSLPPPPACCQHVQADQKLVEHRPGSSRSLAAFASLATYCRAFATPRHSSTTPCFWPFTAYSLCCILSWLFSRCHPDSPLTLLRYPSIDGPLAIVLRPRFADNLIQTPQNTPANNAPISSRAQAPDIASIKEEDLDRAAAASIFAQNPRLVSMMQNKLQGLVGRSSGYVESLPAPVRKRVAGLKGVQKEHAKLEAEFQEEVLQLEKRFFAKFTPLYEKRAKIVNGQSEPSAEEVEAGEADEEEDEEAELAKQETDKKEVSAADLKGIPEFWLSAMKNSSLAETINDRDEEVLKDLTDIRMEYLDRPGFRLIFEFADNDFFSNKTITKTYFYQEENGYGGDFIYDHAEGDKIEWKSGKDLTVKVESKKQRNKNTKQTRIVKKTIPTPSFFDFFNPATPPTDDDDEEEIDEELEAKLELDYQLGEDIKEKLIPRAIDWFTGEALQFEQARLDDGACGTICHERSDRAAVHVLAAVTVIRSSTLMSFAEQHLDDESCEEVLRTMGRMLGCQFRNLTGRAKYRRSHELEDSHNGRHTRHLRQRSWFTSTKRTYIYEPACVIWAPVESVAESEWTDRTSPGESMGQEDISPPRSQVRSDTVKVLKIGSIFERQDGNGRKVD
nr:nucleosome assembly protein 1 [Quercus suber]